MSYDPRRRAVFSFQTYCTLFFRFSIPSFQKSDFNREFSESIVLKTIFRKMKFSETEFTQKIF